MNCFRKCIAGGSFWRSPRWWRPAGAYVGDVLFAELQEHYDEDQIVQLTMTIAWENASSKFNRALRIPSQELWKKS